MSDFANAEFFADVCAGLSRPQKSLSAKYFYDQRGSELFDRICGVQEYYPFRCETEILTERAGEISELMGQRGCWVEFGSGASRKTQLLLDRLSDGSTYVPIDIAEEFLYRTADSLSLRYPHLKIRPICADFTAPLGSVNRLIDDFRSRAVFFPGSTIGNFEPAQATALLQRGRAILGPGGRMVVGTDLPKELPVLEAAYNDRDGVTAAFNLNLLTRINRELGGDFSVEDFEHRAFFNGSESRIEMHLVSRQRQWVSVGDRTFYFRAGESIHTENSYKYGVAAFSEIAANAGLSVRSFWTDRRGYFAVYALEPLALAAVA